MRDKTLSPSLAPSLAHQFDTHEQQREAASLGVWVFLVTEVMFFGVLFASYAIFRWMYPAEVAAGSHQLDIRLGTINTAVLLTSSLTMALAVRSAQVERGRLAAVLLVVTILLGLVFLGIKLDEYHHKFVEHLVPGPSFRLPAVEHLAPEPQSTLALEGPARQGAAAATGTGNIGTGVSGPLPARAAQLFFFLYFAMTGLHALHMVIGIGLLASIVVPAYRGRFTARNHNFIEGTGLYWHFVDIVWIFLFPLLYLVGRHG